MKMLDIIVMAALFLFVLVKWYFLPDPARFSPGISIVLGGLYVLLYVFFVRVYEGLKISIARIGEIVCSQALALLFADAATFAAVCLVGGSLQRVMPVAVTYLVQLAAATVWAYATNKLYYRLHPVWKTVVVGRSSQDFESLWNLDKISRKFRVQKRICVPDTVNEFILEELTGADTVFIRGLPTPERNRIMKFCVSNDIDVYLWPEIGDVMLCGADQTHLFNVPMMRIQRYCPNFEYILIKRAFDILVSAAGLLVLLPLMLLTALAIKLYDGGPVIYKQVRLTQNERKFDIYKFRSMCIDAEKDGIARLSTGNKDNRITPVGKIIRATRIDELPQLINILKGEMSLVGPRPERPEIAEQYSQALPEFRLRLQAKAGLTGYAQVYGKYNSTPYDKLQMDLLYISRPSLLQDFKIFLATIKTLFMRESTEGVAEGQITAEKSNPERERERETVPAEK